MKTLPTAKTVSGGGVSAAPAATSTLPTSASTASSASGSGFDLDNVPVPVGTSSAVTGAGLAGLAGLTGAVPLAAASVNPLAEMLESGYGAGLGSSDTGQPPQTNATNQTGYSPNGNVTQNVTNNNTYHNDIYIQQPDGGYSEYNPYFAAVDPSYGASLLGTSSGGITGWFQQLFQGL